MTSGVLGDMRGVSGARCPRPEAPRGSPLALSMTPSYVEIAPAVTLAGRVPGHDRPPRWKSREMRVSQSRPPPEGFLSGGERNIRAPLPTAASGKSHRMRPAPAMAAGSPRRYVPTLMKNAAEAAERAAMHRTLPPELFSGLLAIAADAVIAIDSAQRIIFFNEGAERIFGWTAAEVGGAPLEMLLPDRLRSMHHRHVEGFGEAHGRARQMGERQQISGLRKSGEEFPAEAAIQRIEVNGQQHLRGGAARHQRAPACGGPVARGHHGARRHDGDRLARPAQSGERGEDAGAQHPGGRGQRIAGGGRGGARAGDPPGRGADRRPDPGPARRHAARGGPPGRRAARGVGRDPGRAGDRGAAPPRRGGRRDARGGDAAHRAPRAVRGSPTACSSSSPT